MNKKLFNPIDISKDQVNILNGNAKELERECFAYDTKIAVG